LDAPSCSEVCRLGNWTEIVRPVLEALLAPTVHDLGDIAFIVIASKQVRHRRELLKVHLTLAAFAGEVVIDDDSPARIAWIFSDSLWANRCDDCRIFHDNCGVHHCETHFLTLLN
jgi:hypothetical protein